MVMQHFSGHLFWQTVIHMISILGAVPFSFGFFLVQGDVKDTYLDVG